MPSGLPRTYSPTEQDYCKAPTRTACNKGLIAAAADVTADRNRRVATSKAQLDHWEGDDNPDQALNLFVKSRACQGLAHLSPIHLKCIFLANLNVRSSFFRLGGDACQVNVVSVGRVEDRDRDTKDIFVKVSRPEQALRLKRRHSFEKGS